jgi:NAD(P)-dependent dehydrogenase (short-subunit alcohol dehydrogenase family)
MVITMLKGKVVVVTGGAGLIGQEFVKAIIEQGGIAVIADFNKVTGVEIKEKLCMDFDHPHVDYNYVDITSKESIISMLDVLHTRHGRIDALVNNAYPRNKNYGRHFFDVEYSDFCENINSHLGGYFLTSQQFAKYFQKQGYGNIVNIASIYGVIAPKFDLYEDTLMSMPVEYAAIKSAIIHQTKYMAKYFKGMNIRVNTLSPGGILDKQPEVFLEAYRKQCLNKGMLDKSDMRGTLDYLLSDLSAYVNGQNIVVDDGFSL